MAVGGRWKRCRKWGGGWTDRTRSEILSGGTVVDGRRVCVCDLQPTLLTGRAPDTSKPAITIVVIEPGQLRDTDVMRGEKADDVSHESKPSCVGRWEGCKAALAAGHGRKGTSETLYLIIVLYYCPTVYLLRCIQRESRSVGGLRGGETTIVNGKTSIIRARQVRRTF